MDARSLKVMSKIIGNKTAWNCMVSITCYSDVAKTTIIDVAHGFPANLSDIPPGIRAYFDAIAFDLNSHDQIKAYSVKITFLERNSMEKIDFKQLERTRRLFNRIQKQKLNLKLHGIKKGGLNEN